ncbi:THO complex subunit 1 transcription elongation factor-domain-containing protein [Fimicolochytrium jonesii]|uniref:THO complex subunit 1 transcription elongation factor-domain-containing protein n=1 Tax=Fimicolochytrium jonesii TaxID=1396493 RepID=UPI0022FDECA7|nr:THO complex subunit 1 transcription elongation factor-domain-containing protein [Fimicolochytrium jonesii]KAI8816086.1 THO complex subunit 1 transcription elongation factor-domain-containing protein [Fimicolochytrium jonesii]
MELAEGLDRFVQRCRVPIQSQAKSTSVGKSRRENTSEKSQRENCRNQNKRTSSNSANSVAPTESPATTYIPFCYSHDWAMSLQATREALAQVLAQAAAIYVDDFSDKDAIIKKSVQELLTPDTSLYIFLSTAFTSAALALVAEHRDDEAKLKEPLYRLLDVSLCCYEAGIQDQSLPFNILEDVLDVLTIEATDILVEYLETRRHRLTMNIDPTKGKGLVLLRMCNEMVRRVSKTRNTLLSGRILMFMANVYPLAERSGVNLRGEFNVKNVTHYEGEDDPIDDDAMEVDGKTDGAEASVYKRLWNLQKYFSNPPLLWQPENLAIFKKGLDLVLKKFEQVNKESILNANKSEEQKIEESAKKRKHELDHESEGVRKKPTNSNGANGVPNGAINGATNPHNERKRRLDSAAEESGPRKKRGNGNTFFPKFLSSPNLFELQLRDPEFRRQILAQSCIILQYISMMSQDEKDRMAKQLVDNPTILNKSVQVPYTLTPEDETWVKETRARIFSACEAMTPGGRQFSKLLLTVITHERNWIEWKNRSCQPFELPPVDITAGVKKPKLPGSETVRRATWLGNDAMTSLWAKGEQVEDILRNPNRKRSIPKFQDAIAMLDEQLDEKGELTGGIEAEYALHTDMVSRTQCYPT